MQKKENKYMEKKIMHKIKKNNNKRKFLIILDLSIIRFKWLFFFKHVTILYYTGPNFLTTQLARCLKSSTVRVRKVYPIRSGLQAK